MVKDRMALSDALLCSDVGSLKLEVRGGAGADSDAVLEYHTQEAEHAP